MNSLGIPSIVVRRTDQKRGKTRLRTSSKSVQTEDPESTSRQVEALDLEFRSRLSSNDSARSSGYFSIRGSDPRLSRFSIPEIVKEESDIQPIHRPRSIQVSKSSQPNRNPNKDKSSDHSQTLPCNSGYEQGAATASSCTNLDLMSSSDSSSSSSSVDSDDTLTSPSTERSELFSV